MWFEYTGNDNGLKTATIFCNELYGDEAFWQEVSEHSQFASTELNSATIAQHLRNCGRITSVKHWRPSIFKRPKYWKTTALTDPNRPYTILYHKKFLANSIAQKVNTLVHEHIHNVDFFADDNRQLEYGHDGQSSGGNEGSAPYAIGAIAQRYFGVQHVPLESIHSEEAEILCDFAKVDDSEIEQ